MILIQVIINFSERMFEFDAALIKLNRRIVFRDEVQRVCLPDPDTSFPVNMECVTTGWGRTRGSYKNCSFCNMFS